METITEADTLALAEFERGHCIFNSLGVRMRTSKPDSSATGDSKCEQVVCRLRDLRLSHIDDKALAIIINSLVVSLAQFAVLEATLSIADCTKMDRTIVEKVWRGYGVTASDVKAIIYLTPQQLGLGMMRWEIGSQMGVKSDSEMLPLMTQKDKMKGSQIAFKPNQSADYFPQGEILLSEIDAIRRKEKSFVKKNLQGIVILYSPSEYKRT